MTSILISFPRHLCGAPAPAPPSPSVPPSLLHPSFLPAVQNVIRSTIPINDEMAHQLYVLQVLTFNLLEDRMMTKMDPQDQVGTLDKEGDFWDFFFFKMSELLTEGKMLKMWKSQL